MSSKSLKVAFVVLALCVSGSALAEKKVKRTEKNPSPGSDCATQEQACLSTAGAGCKTQSCKDQKADGCTKAYNDCVNKNPSPN